MALTKLSKIFSREKGIWYAYVWDESDRLGFKKYLNHSIKHNLFIRIGNKLSVLYDNKETAEIHQKIKDKYLNDKKFVSAIFKNLANEWKHIDSYIEHGKQIKNFSELHGYYAHLVKWWAAMALLFRLDLPEELSKPALEYRQKAEKFSDTMIDVWNNFFIKNGLREILNLITPKEAFATANLSARKLIEIKNRNSGVALYNSKLYSLDDIQNILKKNGVKIEAEKIDDISEFTGSVAFKGKATGVVKIVLLSKDISKVRRGNILVAEMTSPDYVPAIKKSVGLITDEGGITSHAAIVSRELKKPCILATKIATKILKDGDLIEMDANTGIVKILKKHKSLTQIP